MHAPLFYRWLSLCHPLFLSVVSEALVQREPIALAVLISGGGTTLKNLLEQIAAGSLNAEIRLVISSKATAGGLQYAAQAGIPSTTISRAATGSSEAFSAAIFAACRQAHVKMVAMAGFLKHVRIPDDFQNRVLNIHPSLIPAFCGAGFYGLHVHRAVLEYGAKVSGCTVHFVDNEYDHGPILLQRSVDVLENDTPTALARRIFEQECELYPAAINLCAAGRVTLEGRRVRIA
ncbi:MAG: phosphoribosylglycinamide formyltransferase [Planctomycetota bacterium]|nr:phosphoribosylglycinamide formyltransferase [Planctomycetota bacterium]